MATRRTFLLIGDETARGNRPLSELTGINPAYANPQADMVVWNIAAQAWQSLTPGTNSDTAAGVSQYWSFEARMRAALSARYPAGTFYLIKYALPSSMQMHPTLPSWVPVFGAASNNLLTQMILAASAAALAGDTLQIDGIIISLMTVDWTTTMWATFGEAIRTLVEGLRVSIPLVPNTVAGTIRNDAGQIPVAILEPHYKFTGLTDGTQAALNSARLQLMKLDAESYRTRIVRTHNTTSSDAQTFSAGSMVALSQAVVDALFAETVPVDVSTTEADVALLLGDSVVEGTGTNTELQPHQLVALTGAQIWNPNAGQFQVLQAGVNNTISLPPILGVHGPEIPLADLLRVNRDIYFVKGTMIQSFGAPYRGTIDVYVPPFRDKTVMTWTPGARTQLWDFAIQGMLREAISSLRAAGKKPVVKLCAICVGHNDAIFRGGSPDDVAQSVQQMINQTRRALLALGIDITRTRFAICIPSDSISTSALGTTNGIVATEVSAMRDDLFALEATGVAVIDLEPMPKVDGVHLNTLGTRQLAEAFYRVVSGTQVSMVEPLFNPTMEMLRAALRLSKLAPDNDALKMIDRAVLDARGMFYGALGQSGIDGINSVSFTLSPRTPAEHLRVFAAGIEIKAVRLELMRSMPTMFVDGASPIQTWNEEGAFRDASTLRLRDEIKRLSDDVSNGVAQLQSAAIGGGNVSFGVVSPASPGISPGGSVTVF